MNKQLIIFVILVIAAGLVYYYVNKPVSTRNSYSDIVTWSDPIQNNDISIADINIPINNGYINLIPRAKYRIAAKVLSKLKYKGGWTGKISPYDLVLGWGDLVKPELKKSINYSQMGRFYTYRYNYNAQFDEKYIPTHSANCHMIPATSNLRKTLYSLKKNTIVEIEGFLVDVQGEYKRRKVYWNTSLTRTDSGNGSCEIIYVKKIKIGYKTYE